jgi:trans-aconitate methyltransferase
VTEDGWSWDPTLYAGSTPFYRLGRVPYPAALVDRLTAFGLDGTGRPLDVGCGPGSRRCCWRRGSARPIGVDADPDMLAEARTQKTTNVIWRHLRAEELPADLVFRAAGFDGRER